jgi:hypothetical protein
MEKLMEFAPLPDRLNCSHTGTFSPVVLRLEGGNPKGGFCVEEYKDCRPHISLYGDLVEAKHAWLSSLLELQSYTTSDVYIRTLADDAWLFFDIRPETYSRQIYIGEGDGDNGIRSDQQHTADASDALSRMRTVYNEFYDCNV